MELSEINSIPAINFDQILDKTQRYSQRIGFDYLSITQRGNVTPRTRECLLDIIHEQCILKNSSSIAEQLSIHYLDLILSQKYFPPGGILKLVALTCASLALKFEDSREITIEELFDLTDKRFSLKNIQTIEMFILSAFDWELDLVTPEEIIRNLLKSQFKSADAEEIVIKSREFVDLALRDYEICRNSAMFIGIAALLCCFKSMGKTRSTEKWLENILGTYEEEIAVKNLKKGIWAKFNSNKN